MTNNSRAKKGDKVKIAFFNNTVPNSDKVKPPKEGSVGIVTEVRHINNLANYGKGYDQIWVEWENGEKFPIVPGYDGYEIIDQVCQICGHSKSEHHSHIGPSLSGKKIKHVGCVVTMKRTPIDMKEFGITSIGHSCSCHGVKPNTYLKSGIREMMKARKDKSVGSYERNELNRNIRRFKQDVKENPKNLLHWQLEALSH